MADDSEQEASKDLAPFSHSPPIPAAAPSQPEKVSANYYFLSGWVVVLKEGHRGTSLLSPFNRGDRSGEGVFLCSCLHNTDAFLIIQEGNTHL